MQYDKCKMKKFRYKGKKCVSHAILMEVILFADEDVVRSFTRGCEVLPNADEGCDEDIYYETCQYSCESNLCNDNDRSIGPPPTTPPPQGETTSDK